MRDSPSVHAVKDLIVDSDYVDFFSIVAGFDTHFVVRTKEPTNAANDSFTIRASIHWDWNGSGAVNNTTGAWTSSVGFGKILSTPADPKKFKESTAGSIVSTDLTTGTTANDAGMKEEWDKVNQ